MVNHHGHLQLRRGFTVPSSFFTNPNPDMLYRSRAFGLRECMSECAAPAVAGTHHPQTHCHYNLHHRARNIHSCSALAMASVPHKPGKPVIKRKGFTIRDGLVTCHGHARVDGPRLEVMFHPERLSLQRLQKAAENEAKRLFGRPFFAAQLRWHGIKFPKGATEQQLRSLLDKAAAAKKVQSLYTSELMFAASLTP